MHKICHYHFIYTWFMIIFLSHFTLYNHWGRNSVINMLRISHSYKSVHRQLSHEGHRRHSLFCLTQASFAGTRRHLFLNASLLTPIYTVCWDRPITWNKRFSLCHTTTSLPSDLWVSHAICIAKKNKETALNTSKHIGIEVNARETKCMKSTVFWGITTLRQNCPN